MGTANEIFYNSYLKKLRRPEFQREYNPDQSYGANTLFRSEETNPWAGRDQSNAKFGYLGGTPGLKAQVPSVTGGGDELVNKFLGPNANIPMLPSQQKNTFNSLMQPLAGTATKLGSKYASDAILEWMRSNPSESLQDVFNQGGGYEKLFDQMTSNSTSALESAISGSEGGAEAGIGAAADAAGGASSAVPFIGAGLKLGAGAATGKLQKHPGSTIGSAAGGAIGGAVGTIFGPVGTIVGSAAGSMIGDKIGTFVERPSLESGMNVLKPPDTNPMSMFKGLFGGNKGASLKSTDEMNRILSPGGGMGGGMGGDEAQINSWMDILNNNGGFTGAGSDMSPEDLWSLFSSWGG